MNCGESLLRLPTFLLLLQCHRWSVVSKRVVKTHYPCLVWSLDLDSCGGRSLGDSRSLILRESLRMKLGD